jgi:UrcA family protein
MSNYRKTSFLAAIMALAALATFTSAAQAATPANARSVAVSYSNLDLSHTAAVDELYRQIAVAAKRACGSYDARNLRERDDWRQCRDAAVSNAIARFVETRIAALNDKARLRAADVALIAARF